MHERFDESARQVLTRASGEAQALGHPRVDAGHLLAGLLGVGHGLSARVLQSSGITLDGVRARLSEVARCEQPAPAAKTAFTARAKRVLELSLREAQALGRERIAPEHILLALADDVPTDGASVLHDFAISTEHIRGALLAPHAVPRERETIDLEPKMSTASLQLFLKDIGTVRLLTAQEEVELAKRIEDADADATHEMVQSNLRLVVSIAKTDRNQGLSFLDLIQEGTLGLIRATEKYDYRTGHRFGAYATPWIRQSIVRSLSEHGA